MLDLDIKQPNRAYLSKSQYIRGRQCLKSLWLHKFQPELRDEIGQAQQAIFDSGTDVGILAREYFPGGILVPYEGFTLSEQIDNTRSAIDAGATIIYEATFLHDGILIKADILQQVAEGWELYEVKGSTSVKDVYLEDVALQCYVLEGAGIQVSKAVLMHINNRYVRKGAIDLKSLFHLADVSQLVTPYLAKVPERLGEMRTMLSSSEKPAVSIGPHCNDPYPCDFSGHCWQHMPSPSVFDFERIGKKAYDLYQQGYLLMEDVPAEKLNARQFGQQSAWVNKTNTVDTAKVREFLSSLCYPLCFMDFETFATPVPLFDDCRPYQQVPFQFSVHFIDQLGAIPLHKEFLSNGDVAPQRSFVERLLEAIPENTQIIVWNQAFEKTRLKEMAELFPEYKHRIETILDNIIDLMEPFRRRDLYYWNFHGSYSIKKVLPAIVPDLSYNNLEIGDGGLASSEWLRMRMLDDHSERSRILQQLSNYCKLDTFAMVRILEEMDKLSRG